MVSDALREVMLAGEGSGELAGEGVTGGRAEHPVCGDVVAMEVRVVQGRVEDLAWRASGCPACMAVSAAAFKALRGCSAAEAAERLHDHIEELGGLKPFERHAENLVVRAFCDAVGEGQPPS